jgi:hypothetical protein
MLDQQSNDPRHPSATEPSGGATTETNNSKWAPSSKAQLIQAVVSAGTLLVAIFAYIYTVIPTQQLVQARENLASINAALKISQGELLKAQTDLVNIDTDRKIAQRELAEYQENRRALMIDDFVRQVLNRTASIPRISKIPLPPGRHSGSEQARSGFYFEAFHTMFGDEWQKDFWVDYSEGQLSGKNIIDEILSGPLLYPFSESERKTFVKRVSELIENSNNKEAFTTKFAIPLLGSPTNASYDSEEDRRLKAHKQFIAAMVVLRNELLESYKLPNLPER